MPLQDYQMSYRGVTFNDDTFNITRLDGLEDNKLRMGDRDFPQSHGQIPGRHLAKAKTITLYVTILGEPGSDAYIAAIRKLKKAVSPDYGSFDSTLADNEQDKLRFKFRGDKERFIRARPINVSIPMRTHNQFGAQDCILQFKAVDPRTYSNDLYEAHNQRASLQREDFSITHDGYSRAYPRVRLQKPNANVGADLVFIINFGATDPSGKSYDWRTNPDNYLCSLYLRKLLDVSSDGFDIDPFPTRIDGESTDAYSNPATWTATPGNKRRFAQSIIYTCDMQHYINGNDEYIVWKNSYREPTRGNPSRLAIATDGIKWMPSTLTNEYRKWQAPREPFYLIPGVNNLYVLQNTVCDISWRDTDL